MTPDLTTRFQTTVRHAIALDAEADAIEAEILRNEAELVSLGHVWHPHPGADCYSCHGRGLIYVVTEGQWKPEVCRCQRW